MAALDTKSHKMEHPAEHYRTPEDISKDVTLSHEEKKMALNTWEQDAQQLLTASGEGMPGNQEGLKPRDHHRLGEVLRAKNNRLQPEAPGISIPLAIQLPFPISESMIEERLRRSGKRVE
jgi:hypothetical protein